MKKKNEPMLSNDGSVKDLVDNRLAQREEALVKEAENEFDARLIRAERTLQDREESILSEVSLEDREFITQSCSIERIREALDGIVYAKEREAIDLVSRAESSGPLADLPWSSRTPSVKEISNDLKIFDSAARESMGLLENYDSESYAREKLLVTTVRDGIQGHICAYLEQATAISNNIQPYAIPQLDFDWTSSKMNLEPSPEQHESFLISEDASDKIIVFQRTLENLRIVDLRKPLEDYQDRVDSKFLKLIAEFSSLIHERSNTGSVSAVDPFVVKKVLPTVLVPEELVNRTLEGVDLFLTRNFVHDKRLKRLIDFEMNRRARFGLRF